MQLNIAMEGVPNNNSAADNAADAQRPTFTLDDVDMALAHVTSTKYSQRVPMSFLSAALEARNFQLQFCAYNSGRTIGGAVWDIRHGATSILYAVGVNLKKEVVLNGAALDTFPKTPELLIVEGGCALRKATSNRSKKRAKAGESDSKAAANKASGGASAGADDGELAALVDETLRKMGNVLIPCESCSRVRRLHLPLHLHLHIHMHLHLHLQQHLLLQQHLHLQLLLLLLLLLLLRCA